MLAVATPSGVRIRPIRTLGSAGSTIAGSVGMNAARFGSNGRLAIWSEPREPLEVTKVLLVAPGARRGTSIAVRGQAVDVAFDRAGYVHAAAIVQPNDRVVVQTLRGPARLKPMTDSVNAATAHFSPDASRILIIGGDRVAGLWDVHSGRRIRRFITGDDAAFAPDGRLIASAVTDGRIRIWDGRSGKRSGLDIETGVDPAALAFGPDGTTLATTYFDSRRAGATGQYVAAGIRLWDVRGRRALGTQSVAVASSGTAGQSLLYAPNGRWLVSMGVDDYKPLVWNIDTGHWPAIACHIAHRDLGQKEWRALGITGRWTRTCGSPS